MNPLTRWPSLKKVALYAAVGILVIVLGYKVIYQNGASSTADPATQTTPGPVYVTNNPVSTSSYQYATETPEQTASSTGGETVVGTTGAPVTKTPTPSRTSTTNRGPVYATDDEGRTPNMEPIQTLEGQPLTEILAQNSNEIPKWSQVVDGFGKALIRTQSGWANGLKPFVTDVLYASIKDVSVPRAIPGNLSFTKAGVIEWRPYSVEVMLNYDDGKFLIAAEVNYIDYDGSWAISSYTIADQSQIAQVDYGNGASAPTVTGSR